MGIYVNPGNSGFAEINDSKYVDKTMLIDRVNHTIGSSTKLTCISRPRRFGKSYAAKMLTAYHDCSCDSGELFADKKIAETESYEKHRNSYHVIYLEMTSFLSKARQEGIPLREIAVLIKRAIIKDLKENGFPYREGDTLNEWLIRYAEEPGSRKFVFIIDEWDAPIRECAGDEAAQRNYKKTRKPLSTQSPVGCKR